MHRVWASVFS